MKYWLLTIEIISGEYTFYSRSVHKGKFDAEKYASDFYSDAEPDENGWFTTDCGAVAWHVDGLQELKKKDYDILRKFI